MTKTCPPATYSPKRDNRKARKILINYASPRFTQSQKVNAKTGLRWGGFDQVICYGPQDIDAEFQKKHHAILSANGERGWCLWKPYIILKTLAQMEDGDYLFYSDSGGFFIDSIDRLIRIAEKMKHDVVVPVGKETVRSCTKRDILILMDMDDPAYLDEHITPSTYVLLKKSPKSVKFTAEWLELSQDRRLITDDPNVMGKPNYPGCIRHRTQTILTLLYIKYGFMNYNYPTFTQYQPLYDYYKNFPVSDLNFFILTIVTHQPNTNILQRAARKVLLNPFMTRAIIRTSSIIHRIDEQRKTDVNAHINRDRMIRRDIFKYLDFVSKIHAFLGKLYAATAVTVKRRLLNSGKTNAQS